MCTLRLKDLEAELQPLSGFNKPKLELEQYVTSAHLASRIIFTAQTTYDDICQKRVLDLGCGCGILSMASSLVGASYTLGVDVDPDALQIALHNLALIETVSDPTIDFVQADLASPSFTKIFESRLGSDDDDEPLFDTVVMNPPFGTKNKGIDILFLETACRMSKTAVYSLHKTSTRKYVEKKAKEYGFDAQVVAEMRYDLPKTMKMHKQKTLDIAVDFWRFQRISTQ
ncbi:hypothetical protein PCANC_09226 [Puccinia coronata f. sp. avenae]|uniref:Methyltransferase small domain-containing protein n=1 Tax=Puccinia coronata f. sp. avenae TaxID=200324 RepID=A0A2N5SC99_9BASI|nr:hypothetical protein PCASD_22513 [Puccinia coronata f. sp. avenae]PLW10842.1 hypothetical protein PCASD_20012 [Puccinia coronata f. sp. avenae]PLW18578.1 hypothetical protein PCANC_09226 [Puccinia coronata f. sp. avenae]PLW42465.1 hypothetical protein PCASD_04665 [Puccinia coronata f. sp. avenae]